jgi:hypothetical protein
MTYVTPTQYGQGTWDIVVEALTAPIEKAHAPRSTLTEWLRMYCGPSRPRPGPISVSRVPTRDPNRPPPPRPRTQPRNDPWSPKCHVHKGPAKEGSESLGFPRSIPQ